MKTHFRGDDDGWTVDGAKITAPEVLDAIRQCLDKEGPILVEHGFYRGSYAPDRAIFFNFEAFTSYLEVLASPGDAIHVWSFAAVCRGDNELASGKRPDENGLVPSRGVY